MKYVRAGPKEPYPFRYSPVPQIPPKLGNKITNNRKKNSNSFWSPNLPHPPLQNSMMRSRKKNNKESFPPLPPKPKPMESPHFLNWSMALPNI